MIEQCIKCARYNSLGCPYGYEIGSTQEDCDEYKPKEEKRKMNSLYITRHTNGKLVLCAEATKKDGSTCTLYLSWNFLHLNLITPDKKVMYALKKGERQAIV